MIKLARIFQDGMVLQRNKPVSIWGESNSNQMITVTLNDSPILKCEIKIGKFNIQLPPQQTIFNGTLRFEGTHHSLSLNDIDFGEVWIAGGQSNMEFQLIYEKHGKDNISELEDEHMRFFDVGKYTFDGEEEEGIVESENWDQWMSLNKESAPFYSAVGYYFAKELREKYNVPIGIVGCNRGGTTALTWLHESYLSDNELLKAYWEEYVKVTKEIQLDVYIKQSSELRQWMNSDEMKSFMKKINQGHVTPLILLKAIRYKKKLKGNINQMGPHYVNRPSGLYHTMVEKISGYSCAGVIWYQGEEDRDKANIYNILLTELINCWREAWKSDLPFLLVQLAPFDKRLGLTGEQFPEIRKQQEWVNHNVENTYMVSIMDVGDKKDIHPKNKKPVGERLALLAMGKVYKENILCESPELVNHKLEKGSISLSFKNTGQGLTLKNGEIQALETFIDNKVLKGCSYRVEGNMLQIRSKKIKENSNCIVRFAQKGYCKVNLYSSIGLPVKPFEWTSYKIC